MFDRHFSKRRRGPWPQESQGPGFDHRGEHEEDCPRWSQRMWHGRGFGGWRRPPFAHGDDAPFWFGPQDHDSFDRPFRRGGPFGGDPSDEDGGGRHRQRRGDIKYALLELLAEQPHHGYELIKALEQRYGGFYRPSPGSVYPTLQMLEEEGRLTSEMIDGKRVYTITEDGRRLLDEHQQRQAAGGAGPRRHGFRGPGAAPDLHELRQSAMALNASVMQVARHGTPDQVQEAMTLLDTVRREIYAILAKGDAERPG